jgi:nitronate monooxygenase
MRTNQDQIQHLFGTQLALVQAPMAGVQGSALALAVSNAGALGSLPCATLALSALRAELLVMQSTTQAPYNLNFFCHTPLDSDARAEANWRALLAPYYAELGIDASTIPTGPGREPFTSAAADLIDEFKPAVVSFHFGLPESKLLQRVKATGAVVLSSATTVAEALWLEAHGADAVIAQGLEAGGHRGVFLGDGLNENWARTVATQLSTFALVPQVAAAVKCPVIAAGGIADAAGIRAALALGANAVQIGTAYMLCHEATTGPVHRAALQSPAGQITALTNLFTGRPARGIVNRIIRDFGAINHNAPQFPLAAAALAPLRAAAEKAGSGDFTSMWAGQNTSGCKTISAAELTQQLALGLN